MDRTKPLYITSYIKAAVAEASGSNPDKSVFSAVQDAILGVLDQGFTVKGGKAYLRNGGAETVMPEQPAPHEGREYDKGSRKDTPVVLVLVAGHQVLCSYSNILVDVLDLDDLDNRVGRAYYDTGVKADIETLRKVAPYIKGLDCKNLADTLEARHEARKRV